MRAAAKIANIPPAIAASVTRPPADAGEDAPLVGGAVLGETVEDEAVGAELPSSRVAVVGAPVVISSEVVGAAVGTPVPKSIPREPAVGAAVCPNTVGAMENDPPREPAVGAMVAPGSGAAVGNSV